MSAARRSVQRALMLVLLALASTDVSAEPTASAGEGQEIFVARCSVCHSIDYVEMHARFGTREWWEGEVAKMRNVFKAPMSDDEARSIVEYLARAYGPQRTMPSNSMSNTNVAPGRITGGAPRSP